MVSPDSCGGGFQVLNPGICPMGVGVGITVGVGVADGVGVGLDPGNFLSINRRAYSRGVGTSLYLLSFSARPIILSTISFNIPIKQKCALGRFSIRLDKNYIMSGEVQTSMVMWYNLYSMWWLVLFLLLLPWKDPLEEDKEPFSPLED